MTQESLDSCLSALRKKASKNTSVSCFKVYSRRRFVLVSQIGSKKGFSSKGSYHVGSTGKSASEIARPEPWMALLKMMARMSGFAHDLGKANKQFQAKIRGKSESKSDAIRHEWISLKLTQLLLQGKTWEQAWQDLRLSSNKFDGALSGLSLSGPMFNKESKKTLFNEPLDAVMYSILTHHGLLESEEEKAVAYTPTPFGRHIRQSSQEAFEEVLSLFESEYSPSVLADIVKIGRRIQKNPGSTTLSPQAIRGLATFARIALIFSDHEVSSRICGAKHPSMSASKTKTYANSLRRVQQSRPNSIEKADSASSQGLNQTLDYHLEEVGAMADKFCDEMFNLQHALPLISPQVIDEILTPASDLSPYSWQDRAREFVLERKDSQTPALILNIAETGAGKTISNLKLAVTCSPESPRVSFAYNLQTLTLQSGSEYKKIFREDEAEVSVVVGDKGVRALFEASEQQEQDEDGNAPLEQFEVMGEPPVRTPEILSRLFPDGSTDSKILNAPCLVSTIDYLINAGEPFEQANHVKAMLRVMSSDLILDEVDSFDPRALVAVCRIIELSALCGRSVVCSSATVSPSIAQHLVDAFASGAAMRAAIGMGKTNKTFDFFCVDNYGVGFVHCSADADIGKSMQAATQCFKTHIERIQNRIAEREIIKRAKIIPSLWVLAGKQNDFKSFGQIGRATYCESVQAQVNEFHENLSWMCGGKRVSFGLVRMANIASAINVAERLSKDPRNKVCVYHSEELRYTRSKKEEQLDLLLNRKAVDYAGFLSQQVEITKHFGQEANVRFVVVATPVEEAGKDHDFDWAIIDPSSTGSIIQTAGRVNRHRKQTSVFHNVAILQYNYKACKNLEGNEGSLEIIKNKLKKAAFIRPGNEPEKTNAPFPKSMSSLLVRPDEDWSNFALDARRRFDQGYKFTFLDDQSIQTKVSPYFSSDGIFNQGHCSLLSKKTYSEMSLRDTEQSFEIRLVRDESGGVYFELKKIVKNNRGYATVWSPVEMKILWDESGFLSWNPISLLNECHEKLGMNLMVASLRIHGDVSDQFTDVIEAYCPWRGFIRTSK